MTGMQKEDWKEYGVVFFVAITASVINLLSVFVYFFQKPAGTVFIGITHWYEDFFYYLSQFAQGTRGHWLATNQFTTETIPANTNWMINLVLGKLGAVLGLMPWTSYHGSIVLFSFLYVLCIYWVMRSIYPKSQILRLTGFLFALVASPWCTIVFSPKGFAIDVVDFVNSDALPLRRLGGVPHHILQNILTLAALMIFARCIEAITKNFKARRVAAISFAFTITETILFILNPLYVLLSLLASGIVALGFFLQHRTRRVFWTLFCTFLGTAIFIAPLYLTQVQVFAHPFYQHFQQWEAAIPQASLQTFTLSLGIGLILALIGVKKFLTPSVTIRTVGFLYFLASTVLYISPVPALLKLPYYRFLQPPTYVFFAACSMEGLWILATTISRRISRLRVQAIYGVLFFIVFLIQLPVVVNETVQNLEQYYLNSPLNFVPGKLWAGLRFLETKHDQKNVLATGTVELLVPTASGHSVYSAHRSLTYNYDQKIVEVLNFYTLRMTPEDVKTFISVNNIGYVIWQKDLGDYKRFLAAYPFFKIIYDQEPVTIFAAL